MTIFPHYKIWFWIFVNITKIIAHFKRKYYFSVSSLSCSFQCVTFHFLLSVLLHFFFFLSEKLEKIENKFCIKKNILNIFCNVIQNVFIFAIFSGKKYLKGWLIAIENWKFRIVRKSHIYFSFFISWQKQTSIVSTSCCKLKVIFVNFTWVQNKSHGLSVWWCCSVMTDGFWAASSFALLCACVSCGEACVRVCMRVCVCVCDSMMDGGLRCGVCLNETF